MLPAHSILRRLRPDLVRVDMTPTPPVRKKKRKRKGGNAKIAPTVRAAVLERDGNQCRRCRTGVDLTLHHVKLRKDGGKNVAENLITLCRACHNAEHP